MARRRKIPVRKHHGLRDPLKQKEKLEKSLKNVVNNPPTKDEQAPTGSFARFKKLLDDTMAGKKVKRPKPGGCEDLPKNSAKKKSDNYNKKRAIKQFANEEDDDYLRRVNRITRESLQEAEYENKYGVNVIRDPKTGAITIQKRPKNEIDELLKLKAKQKHNRKGKNKIQTPANTMDPKLAKQLIKQAIKEDNEEKAKEKSKELQEYKKDVIQFGEVVHAPPTLSTLPRKAQKNETVPRPGKKNNLLLKSMFPEQNNSKSTVPSTKVTKSGKQKATGEITKAQLKGKRKNLPAATRSMLESERDKMIEVYRQYKKSKQKSQ